LNLTIRNSSSGTDIQSACNAYTWIDGNTYTSSNNTATFTLQNAAGCDSVVTLNLTIKQNTTGVDVQNACGSFTWINGITYTASNNTATHTLTNAAGCDSVVTLNLTVTTADTSVTRNGAILTANATGAAYQWIDCNNGGLPISGQTNQSFTATSNGNYAVVVTQNSCTDTSACYSVTSVGLPEQNFKAGISVSPNPTSGRFNLNLSQSYKHVQVRVRNVLGQEVYSGYADSGQQFELNITGEAGLYFVEVTTDQKSAMLKVLKQ
ncbi:MAG: T9SS type A sorting domain-containing protein, partial [Hymenobacteraceae bacterium]|nr:T9SS type A sorting domain-containing protein [Hymenobacteraceae bacterium]MDX5394653.1 T9SS type A sorting domain-containing protein [Hymenobacteraceae bacterium]MDX5510684.1 T9SS type A sorting domain-containing protein [Hymenobacteraceae bacterium]